MDALLCILYTVSKAKLMNSEQRRAHATSPNWLFMDTMCPRPTLKSGFRRVYN